MQTSVEAPGLLLVVLDLTGIFVFAISGGLVGVRKGLDVFGVLVLAGATGLGGGFMRDVLIGAVPPAALADWRYLMVPVAAGLVTFWFHPALGRMERLVTVFDAAGLGKVWDGLDAVARRVIQDGGFHIAAPMEFRFIKAGDSAMSGTYSTNPDAYFVNLDLIGFIEATPSAAYPADVRMRFRHPRSSCSASISLPGISARRSQRSPSTATSPRA